MIRLSFQPQSSHADQNNQQDETNLMAILRTTATKTWMRRGWDKIGHVCMYVCIYVYFVVSLHPCSVPRLQKCMDSGPETWTHILTSTLHFMPRYRLWVGQGTEETQRSRMTKMQFEKKQFREAMGAPLPRWRHELNYEALQLR